MLGYEMDVPFYMGQGWCWWTWQKWPLLTLTKEPGLGIVRALVTDLFYLTSPALGAMDFNLQLSPLWKARSTLQAFGLLIFIISLNTPVKLSKGKGKSSNNYPYFIDRGDGDRKVVQLSSLMSCGERQKKDPDLRKSPSIPHPPHHCFTFTTSWLRIS